MLMVFDRRTRLSLLLSVTAVTAFGCGGDDSEDDSKGEGSNKVVKHGLTKKESEKVLVEVGDTEISVGEFADRLADQSPYLRARYNSPERRRDFLDDMVRFELLAMEAERRGMHELPEVRRNTKQVMIQQMMKDLFEEQIKLSDISDEEIERYYEEHEKEFNKPEQRRASHIRMRNRHNAKRVLAQVKADPDDASLFRSLAEKHNNDPDTKERYGDLRFFYAPGERPGEEPAQDEDDGQERRVPEAVAEAAFELEKIGDVYPELVRSDRGWHIIKLTGLRGALRRPLEQARRTIQNRLWRQKRKQAVEEFVDNLRKESEVEVDMDALGKVKLNLPKGESPTATGPQSAVEPPTDGPGTPEPSPADQTARSDTP